jgi:aminoglycoside N3'-acetyltransferase
MFTDTVRGRLKRLLTEEQQRRIKVKLSSAKKLFIDTFMSYDAASLKSKLRSAGIAEGDTLMVHANFEPHSGFRGDPIQLVNALAELVGEGGNLLMVSIPFRGAAHDYLMQGKTFNVNKTVSLMGLVTELFRRRAGTQRSLHPTHPVLAYGKDASWILAGHENCLYPCGPGSPFEKFHKLGGKILFFDVSFQAITFYHYVEDLLKESIPFPVYEDRMFDVKAVDSQGVTRIVRTYTFNNTHTRNCDKLQATMERSNTVSHGKVGNSRFLIVTAGDVVSSFKGMVEEGNYPYDN